MNKGIIATIIITLIIVLGGAFLLSRSSPQQALEAPTGYEYYWGEGCPHCKIVADFLESWENKDKLKMEKYEVWYNRDNASRMQKRADACGISRNEQGVPFLVTPEGKCLVGDVPIIDLFKNMTFE